MNLPNPTLLGIEAGATRTTALGQIENDPSSRNERVFGPANLQLLDDRQLLRHLRTIARAFPLPDAVAVGMAGARSRTDRDRLHAAMRRVWPRARCTAVSDLDVALASASSPTGPPLANTVLVLSGTGSCCYALDAAGEPVRVGGWGHLLGDAGSGYDIALQGLRCFLDHLDRTGRPGPLGPRILAHLHLNDASQLLAWSRSAAKGDIAALAPHVFATARDGDSDCRRILANAANALADAALACAARIADGGKSMRFLLAGSVLKNQPSFAATVRRLLLRKRPSASVAVLDRPGTEGAIALAHASLVGGLGSARVLHDPFEPATNSDSSQAIPRSTRLSPTEERNPRSTHLDRLAPGDAIELMLREDARLPHALLTEKAHLERALRLVVRALRHGGRLFYVGAGTSGRLGILDASECPPTFRTPPELVQGIIAGGPAAVFESVEGAEDDFDAGRTTLRSRAIRSRDVVVGIAASGQTPFVWGALQEARRHKAPTILVCFNPHLVFARGQRPTVVIAPHIGPEILTGSTRLKAGTATKLILNILTTLAMVRLGKVVENLMVDLNPANAKLRNRAIRIVRDLSHADESACREALERSGWVVTEALDRLLHRRRRSFRPT